MVKIRLMRIGKKKNPFYQIIVTDIRNARNGKFIEKLGFFSYVIKNNRKIFSINENRMLHWIQCGAKISKRVQNLMKHK